MNIQLINVIFNKTFNVKMKDIKLFLEEKKSVFTEIMKYAEGWIDYIYNEGVIDYDDQHLVDYNKGKKKPDFKEIVKGILDEYSKDLDNTTSIVLNKYLKDGGPKDGKQSAVENAILAAIEKFVEEGNCEECAEFNKKLLHK